MATDTFVKFRCNEEFARSLDFLACDGGDLSRADLLERLILAEAARRGREMPRRIDLNVHDSYAKRKAGDVNVNEEDNEQRPRSHGARVRRGV